MTTTTTTPIVPAKQLVLDADKSRVRLRTFAEGLLARLAHDLELVCGGISGTGEQIAEGRGSVRLEVPVHRIDIHGTLKDGRVDPKGFSPSDREDCLSKMRKDVFRAPSSDAVVRVEATLESKQARVRIIPPNGKAVERSVAVRVEPSDDNTTVTASGSFKLSIAAIGGAAVKGPMNAFRVKDEVEVLFDVVLVPEEVTNEGSE